MPSGRRRPHFARSCFDFWIEDEKTSVYWWKAYLDERVLVTVNPDPSVESAWVHLAKTGSRHSLRLKDWERWLRQPCDAAEHPIEAIALARAKRTLGAAVPTRERLLAAVDRGTKKELLEKALQKQAGPARGRRRNAGEEIPTHNQACDRLYLEATKKGLKCPHCGRFSRNYRLASRNGERSLVICRECGWVMERTRLAKSLRFNRLPVSSPFAPRKRARRPPLISREPCDSIATFAERKATFIAPENRRRSLPNFHQFVRFFGSSKACSSGPAAPRRLPG